MPTQKSCPECGTEFECCNDGTDCWCAELPNIIPLTEGSQCLCPECLKKKIDLEIQRSENQSA